MTLALRCPACDTPYSVDGQEIEAQLEELTELSNQREAELKGLRADNARAVTFLDQLRLEMVAVRNTANDLLAQIANDFAAERTRLEAECQQLRAAGRLVEAERDAAVELAIAQTFQVRQDVSGRVLTQVFVVEGEQFPTPEAARARVHHLIADRARGTP